MHFSPPVAMFVVRSKAVVSLFTVAPVICVNFVFGPCFTMQYLVSFLVLQSS